MTRNQHFVPQFLLRNWSDDKKTINIFLKKESSVKNRVSIKDQSQKDYFYGKDQKVESFLASIEANTSCVIEKILREQNADSIGYYERLDLNSFVTVQRIRTPNSRLQTQEILTAFVKSLMEKVPQYTCLSDNLDSLVVSTNNPTYWFFQEYLMTLYLYFDLCVVLLKSSQNQFVIGQDPLFTVNPFLSEIGWPYSHSGLAQKGLMVFLPLSPTYVLCLYDKTTYRFKKENKMVHLCSADVDLLNLYQFIKSKSCVYFKDYSSDLMKYNEFVNGKNTIRNISISDLRIKESDYLSYQKVEEYNLSQSFYFVGILCEALNKRYDRNTIIRDCVKDFMNEIRNNPSLNKILGPFIE